MSTIGKAQKNFGPAANRPSVKIAYTAAIGDTSAKANDSAERKLKPRSSWGGRVSDAGWVSSGWVIVASMFVALRRHCEPVSGRNEVIIRIDKGQKPRRSSRDRGRRD